MNATDFHPGVARVASRRHAGGWGWKVLRLLFAGLFIAAGASKISDPFSFALSIAGFAILPSIAVASAAVILPWVEIVCGVALLVLPRYREAALGILLALLLAFTGVIFVGLARGAGVSCGCFGNWGTEIESLWLVIPRNLLLLILGVALYVRRGPGAERSGGAIVRE